MGSIAAALQLPGYIIDNTERQGHQLLLHVHQQRRPRPKCPHCGHRKPWRHGGRTRRVSHLPWGQSPCDLVITVERFRCPACHKTFTPRLPGIARRARLSTALRDFVHFLVVKQGNVLKRLQSWLKLGWNTLAGCLRESGPPDLCQLRHLCLDEVAYRRPRTYLTILSDGATGRVLGTSLGRGNTPSRTLLNGLPAITREGIETLATDLNTGQRKAAYACLPDALVCADLFHVVRLAKRAIRNADREQQRVVRQAVRQLLKVLRGRDGDGFQRWLKGWQGSAGTLQTLHNTLTKWEVEVENYLTTGRTTGPAEALNRKIALLRRQACGYTNLDNFNRRIMLLNDSLHPER